MTTPTSHSQSLSQSRDASQVEHWTTAGTVHGPLTQREAEAVAEREQVMVADSSSVGLLSLAGATLTISAVFANWFGLTGVIVAIPILLIFGGLGQFLAGMWAFRRGDVLAATLWTMLGGFYATLALLFWLLAAHLLASALAQGSVRGTMGTFMVTFSLIVLGLGGTALLKNQLFAAIFLVLGVAYLFDGLGIWTGTADWLATIGGGQSSGTTTNWLLILGGYVGIVASLLAIYQAIAIVVDTAAGYELVPVRITHARGR